MAKTNALGKSLDSLLGSSSGNLLPKEMITSISEINISEIEVNPNNPRENFDETQINELAESIKSVGIIQPITVRRIGNKYQIISGERRFRASSIAGLHAIPAYIKTATDEDASIMALVENLQRTDLNPMEVAKQYKNLSEKHTQDQIAKLIGKSRPAIANQLRLFDLPAEAQLALQDGKITTGHTRPILALKDDAERIKLLRQIIAEELSVREAENIVYKKPETKSQKKESSKTPKKEPKIVENSELTELYDTKVYVQRDAPSKGKIIMSFFSENEYNDLVKKLKLK